jgi:hypothetical protein
MRTMNNAAAIVGRFSAGATGAACLATAIMLGGCMTSRIESTKDAATGIGENESIVIMSSSYHVAKPAENAFIECVTKNAQSGSGKLRVYPAAEFRDALFPWLEPRTAPAKAADLPELLDLPGVQGRIRDRNVRYIVWIQGKTEESNSNGGLACAAGPTGGACFGLAWWDNLSSYEAAIWDLEGAVDAGKVTTSVNGTSMVPALIVPVPFIARTRAAACKGMARQLQTFIAE